MPFVKVEAEAYAGYKGAERPLFFLWEGRRYDVVEVLDRWYEGGRSPKDQKLDYFRVRTEDGEEFILRYNALFNVWSLMTG